MSTQAFLPLISLVECSLLELPTDCFSLCVELPELLSVVQLSEGLLCLERGPELLAKMVANMPDSFHQGVYT